MSAERAAEIRSELQSLFERTGIRIDGCGCCESPFALDTREMNENGVAKAYGNYGGFRWDNDNECYDEIEELW